MKKTSGTLILVPTPISEEGPLDQESVRKLGEAWNDPNCLICGEDPKPSRRRWLAWGLPREAIEKMLSFNEHSGEDLTSKLWGEISRGKTVYLMSDGGMPGFCDPGRELIFRCQQAGFRVSSLPIANSLLPAVAMSGFTEGAFEFLGFPPRDKKDRQHFFSELAPKKGVVAFMDTPYRLEKCIEELAQVSWKGTNPKKEPLLFLAMDLFRPEEEMFWGSIDSLLSCQRKHSFGKREFVAIISA